MGSLKLKRENSSTVFLIVMSTALCLRAPITSVGAILFAVIEDLQISGTLAGLLNTIPLVVMAVLSPFISKISLRLGLMKSLLLGILLIVIGTFIRSFLGISGLLIGTGVIGAGISFGNVLIPAIIKVFFPNEVGKMTGLFTVFMSICSGIGAGISVPLAVNYGWGWRYTFCIWAACGLVTIILIMYQLRLEKKYEKGKSGDLPRERQAEGTPAEYNRKLAWALTLMFGGQSAVFYMMAAWLPTIVADKGIGQQAAGYIAMAFQVTAIPINFLVPVIAGKMRDHRLLILGSALMGLTGLTGLMKLEGFEMLCLSAGLVTVCLGGIFSLSLTMFSLKSRSSEEAVFLSGFAQSFGYVMAAIGPFLAGFLYDLQGAWGLPIVMASAFLTISAVSGMIVGKNE